MASGGVGASAFHRVHTSVWTKLIMVLTSPRPRSNPAHAACTLAMTLCCPANPKESNNAAPAGSAGGVSVKRWHAASHCTCQ